MERDQDQADAAEEKAIRRLRFLREMRGDPWVRRLVAVALAGYLAFSLIASAGPMQHRAPACLVLPQVARPGCDP